MALQGTIDAFPLTDVLQLLSSSAKSGRLLLEGDRGRAELWIEEGSVVGGDPAGPASGAAQLVFELLRFDDGSFVFDPPDATADGPPLAVEPVGLDECVRDAVALLEEWERIEAVVPSMRHRLRLVDELVEDEVTLGAQEWRLVTVVGDGPSVARAAERLGLDEFACCAALAELVGRSLLVVEEPMDGSLDAPGDVGPAPVGTTRSDLGSAVDVGEPATDPDASAVRSVAAEEETFPEHFPIDDLLGGSSEAEGPWSADDGDAHRFAAAQTFDTRGTDQYAADAFGAPETDLTDRTAEAWDDVVAGQSTVPEAADGPVQAIEEPWQELPIDTADQQAADETADEVLRQMSRLSPKAAEAIAAALNSPSSSPAAPLSHDTGADRRDGDGPVTFMGSF